MYAAIDMMNMKVHAMTAKNQQALSENGKKKTSTLSPSGIMSTPLRTMWSACVPDHRLDVGGNYADKTTSLVIPYSFNP